MSHMLTMHKSKKENNPGTASQTEEEKIYASTYFPSVNIPHMKFQDPISNHIWPYAKRDELTNDIKAICPTNFLENGD